jgi:hypothetical protein
MTSICIFGSTARGRADYLSDRDVLLAAPSEAEINDAARYWRLAGWSIAKFTHQQMLDMAARGSLFLQHLKQEGLIVRDQDGFLVCVINHFRPRHNYENETCESFALLSDIASFRSTYWPTLCAADIAYGAIRNIGDSSPSVTRYIFI